MPRFAGNAASILLKLRSMATRLLPSKVVGFSTSSPVKLLLARFACCNEGKRKNHPSRSPVKELALSSTTSSCVNPWKDDLDSGPDRALLVAASSTKFGGRAGNDPVN